ncbi:MlaD family protein, partial [Desulfonatronospira sp.]|uniref:MlaD family protein n=1 Tax=Desulfonatronospira sp. TaxID=1962951 RepID=UPI0025C05B08
MSTQPNYYTIGIFVSIGLALFLGALAVLGAGALWRETLTIETYLDESVQGIDKGSQVKMRGVTVGRVDEVTFVGIRYPEAGDPGERYVLLQISLELNEFGVRDQEAFERFLEREIQKGLRIRLLPMGITGAAYLEMDYVDPVRHPPLPVNWEPRYTYIPSAPGTFARLEETFESLGNTMAKIEEMDIQKTLNHLDHLIQSLDKSVQSFDLAGISARAEVFIEELRDTNRKISGLIGPLEDPEEKRTDLHAVLKDSRQILQKVDKGLDRLQLDKEGGAADQIARTLDNLYQASKTLPETMDSIGVTAASLKESSKSVERLSSRSYTMLRSQNEELRRLLQNMQIISENL